MKFYDKSMGKYGLIDDGTIVEIFAWTKPNEGDIPDEQELYFKYTRFGKRKITKFIEKKRILLFSDKKRYLKTKRKEIKGRF